MNASLQTNDWKKTLQTFLKGSGKSLMNDFNNKTILVSLTGGSTHVVSSKDVDSFMEGNGIKSVLQQYLQFKPTEQQTMKAYFKEAPDKNKVNLIVYNQQEDLNQRNNLFVLNELGQMFQQNPKDTKYALNQFYNDVQNSGSQIEHIGAKIGKILADHGFPLAYLVIFSDNTQQLQKLSHKCNNQLEYQENQFKLQKGNKNPLQILFDQLADVDVQDYCKVYQKYGIDHQKLSCLEQQFF